MRMNKADKILIGTNYNRKYDEQMNKYNRKVFDRPFVKSATEATINNRD